MSDRAQSTEQSGVAAGTRDEANEGPGSNASSGAPSTNESQPATENGPDEESDGPPEEGDAVKIPGSLSGLRERKELDRARLGMEQPPGGRKGDYRLPYQPARSADS